jgi:hypothetical protein
MKSDIIQKRNGAETLSAEVTSRLNAALKNLTEVVAAQALLVSGNAKPNEASRERENL